MCGVVQFKILGSPEEASNAVTLIRDYEGHAKRLDLPQNYPSKLQLPISAAELFPLI